VIIIFISPALQTKRGGRTREKRQEGEREGEKRQEGEREGEKRQDGEREGEKRQEEEREGEKSHWPTSIVKCSTMLIPAFNCILFCLTYRRLQDESR